MGAGVVFIKDLGELDSVSVSVSVHFVEVSVPCKSVSDSLICHLMILLIHYLAWHKDICTLDLSWNFLTDFTLLMDPCA